MAEQHVILVQQAVHAERDEGREREVSNTNNFHMNNTGKITEDVQ